MAIVLLSLLSHAVARPALDKPNIVMFFVDDLGFTGHPTTSTPNIDKLARGGKILSSWYSGCPVCSGSRAALMTGRQFTRLGVPGVFGPSVATGLPLNETTVADQLKKAGYATAIMGKWHLGQRPMFLPGARGFDTYLGIPYSDDMGQAARSPCPGEPLAKQCGQDVVPPSNFVYSETDGVHGEGELGWRNLQDLNHNGDLSPLVFQSGGVSSTPGATTHTAAYAKNTTVLEQPLDFTTLAPKYNNFVTDFIDKSASAPFFLYMPFSHVHTTAGNQPQKQYASCMFQNTSDRGAFGDALSEVDWIVGNVVAKLRANNISQNTLILLTGDNGPWLIQGLSGGSPGVHNGRYAGYWNTGKGSTWEGGIHEAAFAHWEGTITPATRTHEVTSSLDLFPTASALAGVPLPTDRVYDGRDMSDVLLKDDGKSKHDVLFFYGGARTETHGGPSAARMGCWKAHWGTGPGLGGCKIGAGVKDTQCPSFQYPVEKPLLFNICVDPSEGIPLAGALPSGSNPGPSPVPVSQADIDAAVSRFVKAYNKEVATFTHGHLIEPDLLPGEKAIRSNPLRRISRATATAPRITDPRARNSSPDLFLDDHEGTSYLFRIEVGNEL